MWLEKYTKLPPGLRLYDVDIKRGHSERRTFIGSLPERLDIYDAALNMASPPRKRNEPRAAPGKEYTYTIDSIEYRVRLPEFFVGTTPSRSPRPAPSQERAKGQREPIKVSKADLKRAARAMECADPQGHWVKRVDDLCLVLAENQQLDLDTNHFLLDGMFHLVGLMASGKSTWLAVLTYHLVVEQGLHVSLLLNTVADMIKMAERFRKMGICAVPVSGRDRASHRLKYALTHGSELLPEEEEDRPCWSSFLLA
jgi:hypothetical protein